MEADVEPELDPRQDQRLVHPINILRDAARREGGSVPGARLVGRRYARALARAPRARAPGCAGACLARHRPVLEGCGTAGPSCCGRSARARGRIGRRGGAAAAERPGAHPQLSRDRAPWRGDLHAAHALPRRRGSGADAPQRRAPRGLHASVEADVRGPRHHVRRDRGIGSDPSRKRGQARRPVPPSLYVRHHGCTQGRRAPLSDDARERPRQRVRARPR